MQQSSSSEVRSTPMHFKFFCPHCGQHVQASSDDVGSHVACPTCAQAFTVPAPPKSPAPLPSQRASQSTIAEKNIISLSVVGIIAFILFALGTNFNHVSNDEMRAATLSAWKAMQQADLDVQDIRNRSQQWGKQATLYSQIDLTNVDKELIELIKSVMSVSSELRGISLAIEREIEKLDSNAVEATQWGMLLGGLFGDSANMRQNALAGGMLVGGLSEAGRKTVIDNIFKKHQPRLDDLLARGKQLAEHDKVLAKRLSDKYKTTFIDP